MAELVSVTVFDTHMRWKS